MISRPRFNAANWYWIVGGNPTQVYSSARGTFVPVADPTFVAWKAAGNKPTSIDSAENLGDVIAAANVLRPVDANVLDGYLNAKLNAIDLVQFRILFNHENRIRTLATQPNITAQQFKAAIKSLI